jgi:hypothetical protein
MTVFLEPPRLFSHTLSLNPGGIKFLTKEKGMFTKLEVTKNEARKIVVVSALLPIKLFDRFRLTLINTGFLDFVHRTMLDIACG